MCGVFHEVMNFLQIIQSTYSHLEVITKSLFNSHQLIIHHICCKSLLYNLLYWNHSSLISNALPLNINKCSICCDFCTKWFTHVFNAIMNIYLKFMLKTINKQYIYLKILRKKLKYVVTKMNAVITLRGNSWLLLNVSKFTGYIRSLHLKINYIFNSECHLFL